MKKQLLLCALIGCALPVAPALAQLDGPRNVPARALELPFRQISPDQARALTVVKPIALNLSDVTLRAALEELGRQSGATIEFTDNVKSETLNKKLSLKLETGSLRQAFDAIVQEAGVNAVLLREFGNGAYMVDWNEITPAAKAPQDGAGPFQIQLQGLAINSFERLTLDPVTRTVRAPDKNLNVRLVSIDNLGAPPVGQPIIRLTRADDEKGRSLLIPQPPFFGMRFLRNYPALTQLGAPVDGAQKLAHLEGEATYILSTKNLIWELADIVNSQGAAHEFESAGQIIRVAVESAQIGGDSVAVNFKVNATSVDAPNAPEDATNPNALAMGPSNPLVSSDVLLSALRIEDANGQILRPSRLKLRAQISSKGGNSEASIETQFFAASNANNGGNEKLEVVGPLKLVFDGPVEFVQTQVPFAFKDVPLP